MELTATLIHKYGIRTAHNYSVHLLDDLFSGNRNDPAVMEDELGMKIVKDGERFDVSYAIAPPKVTRKPNGLCELTHVLVTQIIVFKDQSCLDRYINDEITIFDVKEI